jgi:hypothetical protein
MTLGADCVVSCWAIMAAMALCGHALLVVIPLAWVSWFERRLPHHVSGTRVALAAIAATGVAALALTVG